MHLARLSLLLALCGVPAATALRLPSRLVRRDVLAALTACCHVSNAQAASVTGDTSRYCKTSSTPAATVVTCLGYGLQKDGRLNSCAADEACIASSAVSNPSKFAPPWVPSRLSPEAADSARAWRALVAAVEDQPGLRVVERRDDLFYLRATGAASVPQDGIDDVEFRMLPESPPKALFRSATRQAVFVYPLQQPVPNQNSHAERLEQIRRRVGWETLGLAGDGALEANMGARQVRNFFGLQMRGVRIPDEYDDE